MVQWSDFVNKAMNLPVIQHSKVITNTRIFAPFRGVILRWKDCYNIDNQLNATITVY